MVEEDEAEALPGLFGQDSLSVRPSGNTDSIFFLRLRSEAEGQVDIQRVIRDLRQTPGIRALQPAAVDADGFTRFFRPDRAVLQLTVGPGVSRDAVLQSLRADLVQEFGVEGLVEVTVPPDTRLGAFLARANASSDIVFAEPAYYGLDDLEFRVVISGGDRGVQAESVTVDWNLAVIGLPAAWNHTQGRPDVVVGVIDGLPEVEHEALASALLAPVAEAWSHSSDRRPSAHATSICGIVAGSGQRYTGVAPGVRVLPLVVDLAAQLYAERGAAIRFAAECARRGRVGDAPMRRLVLGCSWRTAGDVAVVRTALEEAVEADVLVICSAGNSDSDAPHYPSSYSGWPRLSSGVVSVAASDARDRKATYSNFAASVDIVAPGGDGHPLDEGDIPCPGLRGSYERSAGTSMAVPHVAAAAALLLCLEPELPVAEVKRRLAQTAEPLSAVAPVHQGKLGAGRLAVGRLLAASAQRPDPEPAPPSGPTPPSGQTPQQPGGPRLHIAVGAPGPRVTITTT